MATISVHVNAFEELATRNAPMGIIWTIHVAIVGVDTLHNAAKAAIINMDALMDTLIAAVTTPNILAIITTRLRDATGPANTNIGLQYINLD